MPLYMAEDYIENLRRLRGLRFDSGMYDEFSHIHATSIAFSEHLDALGVEHVFEAYNGDHRNRVWGRDGRLATEVLLYFDRLLELEPAGGRSGGP